MALSERGADWLAAVIAGGAAFGVYALTLAPDILPGDSGEFQMAAPLLSIVHPTGYPLYLLIAKLFTLLPVGTVAYRVNLFSAVSEAFAVGVVATAMGASLKPFHLAPWPRRLIAVSAALAFAFTATVWLQGTEAEVYALHALFVAVIIGLAMRAREPGQAETVVPWLALATGLSLAHHRATLLLFPALAVLLWGVHVSRRTWTTALVLAAMPMLLYLYTPLRYDASPYMRIVLDASHTMTTLANTPAAMLGHVLGTSFRGALGWDALSLERLGDAPGVIASAFGGVSGWLVIALAAIGAVLPWFVRGGGASVRLAAALAVTLALSVGFNATYHIGDISDYYMPVLLVVVWLAALGAGEIVRRVPSTRAAVGMAAIALTLPTLLLLTGFAEHLVHASVRSDATALLPSAPPDAILISNDRDEMTPILYLQHVDGMRRDVTPLFPLISADLPDVVRLTRYALESSRPVMFTKAMPGLETAFDVHPAGLLARVAGPADVTYVQTSNAKAPAARLLGWSVVTAAGTVTVSLIWEADTTPRPDFATYVHVVSASGGTIAQSDHVPGGAFYPPSQWQARDVLRDEHRMFVPANEGSAPLRLEAGAYVAGGSDALSGIGRIDLGGVQIGP